MKLSQDVTSELMLCIDARVEKINKSSNKPFVKESNLMDLVLMCEQLGLMDKAKEVESNIESESDSSNPNEDRDNDTEYRNERESNFQYAWK